MKTLYHVEHPDETLFDQIDIRVMERWKESDLSGDEWRFSYLAYCYKKGVLLATLSGGSIAEAAAKASLNHYPAEFSDQETFQTNLLLTNPLCDQPGCDMDASVFYLRLKRYTKQGEELLREGGDQYRQFCNTHRNRGDCDLDDAMHNYKLLENVKLVIWVEESAYLRRNEAHCSCGYEFSAPEDNIMQMARMHLIGSHEGGVLVDGINITAFLDDNVDEEVD